MNPITLAQSIPSKARSVIYSVLLTIQGLELIWDLIPDVLEGRVLATVSFLGFGLAVANVQPKIDD